MVNHCLQYQLTAVMTMKLGHLVKATSYVQPKDFTVPTTATLSNVVIKAVFGRILSREQTVNVLKSKFLIKQSNLKNLTPTHLQQVLIKKLVKNNYVSLKEGKTNTGNFSRFPVGN